MPSDLAKKKAAKKKEAAKARQRAKKPDEVGKVVDVPERPVDGAELNGEAGANSTVAVKPILTVISVVIFSSVACCIALPMIRRL